MTSLFQLVMDKIFGDLPFVAVYVDDITVFSKTLPLQALHVGEVMHSLNKWKLRVRLDKSRFVHQKVRLLGFIVSGPRVEKDPKKVKGFLTLPKLETGKQMMRFLGSATITVIISHSFHRSADCSIRIYLRR